MDELISTIAQDNGLRDESGSNNGCCGSSPSGRSSSSKLEDESNNLKQECQEETGDEIIKVIKKICKCRMCPDCRKRMGIESRIRLIKKAYLFLIPCMFTFTIKRELFKSPEEAYEYVMINSLIPRLFRLLGIKRWIWVLEAQEKTGDGWPHWHILIDVSELRGMYYNCKLKIADTEVHNSDDWIYISHYFDINRARELLIKWGVGEQCYLSEKKSEFDSAEHAIFYISKYLIKISERGSPPWMLNKSCLRFMGASRGIGRIVSEEYNIMKRKQKRKRKNRKIKKPYERIAECGKNIVFMKYESKNDKDIYLGDCNAPVEAVKVTPWAIKQKDFDFKSGNEFDRWGFKNVKDAAKFVSLWNEKGMQDIVNKSIEKEKNKLLSQWKDEQGHMTTLGHQG